MKRVLAAVFIAIASYLVGKSFGVGCGIAIYSLLLLAYIKSDD